ncbi:MAG: recombinase family protein [Candidatus Roizmanbacteria bacterium]|nr:recombinase family protein [Candidatus Roizmanbacteria bacterium]
MKNNTKKVAVGYIRSATGNKKSLEDQENSIKQYCEKESLELTALYIDSKSSENLPGCGLSQMFLVIGTVEIDCIVCANIDRLSREKVKSISMQQYIKEVGVEIKTVQGGVKGK